MSSEFPGESTPIDGSGQEQIGFGRNLPEK